MTQQDKIDALAEAAADAVEAAEDYRANGLRKYADEAEAFAREALRQLAAAARQD